MKNKMTVSNFLILLSFIGTILVIYNPNLYILGVNNSFLKEGLYHIYIIQFFTGTFIHGGFFHFFANALFLYLFGNILEIIIGRKKYIYFFIFIVIFNGLGLSLLESGNTIGISGFCMALVSYYTLELKSRNNPDFKGGILALMINIGIGLSPGISFMGHLLGAIGGVIFYLLNKKFLQTKLIGFYNIEKS